MKHLVRTVLSGAFPRRHFLLASCTAGMIGFALLLPTPEVSAKRTEVPLELEVSQPNPDNFSLKSEIIAAAQHAEEQLLKQESKPVAEKPKSSANSGKKEQVPVSVAKVKPAKPDTRNAAPKAEVKEVSKAVATAKTTKKEATPKTGKDGLHWKHVAIKSGDNLSDLFQSQGVSATYAHKIARSSSLGKALNWIKPGQSLSFGIDAKGQLAELKHIRNKLETAHFIYKGGQYHGQMITRTPDIVAVGAAGKITDALYLAGQKAGIPHRITMHLADIFAWDIDFALDIREGDTFRVLYEEHRLDGERIGFGDILAAEFINQGERYQAIRYTDSRGKTAYYAPDGKSLRKAFLRTPVEFARISSHFNLKRRHPVLNRIRAHKGVDYAAPHGTAIKSVGDGKVTFSGKKGGYGNVVIIQHGQRYQTLYAHMSGFARGVKVGREVLQGQVIGYVGMTGLATGPHLHYEFRINGNHVNPVTVKFPNAAPIAKTEMSRFKKHTTLVMARLNKSSPTMLASSSK
ncbi:OapA family protein [Endozoicomonadaceae bacterium StTr2]